MSDELETNFELIAARIKHILTVYPSISPTMLQAALGPQVPANEWRPVLEDMMQNGIVVQDSITSQSPAGRYNDYTRISLSSNT